MLRGGFHPSPITQMCSLNNMDGSSMICTAEKGSNCVRLWTLGNIENGTIMIIYL